MARQLQRTEDLTLTTVPATEGDTFYFSGPVILAELEIAALKSAILTFDHLLIDHSTRFTRDASVEDIRRFIRAAVLDGVIDRDSCHRYSLGIQYERIGLYEDLRRRIPFARTPFEHVLIAAGDAAGKCIDIVWNVFGCDPFGFRLTYSSTRGSFAFAAVNGVLRDTGASQLYDLPPIDGLLCGPTARRSHPGAEIDNRDMEDVLAVISDTRQRHLKEGFFYVEMHADDAVIDKFREAAACAPAEDRTFPVQLRRKLTRLYGRLSLTAEFQAALEEVVDGNEAVLDVERLRQDVSAPGWAGNDAAIWLQVYRTCLQELRDAFGLPGDIFLNNGEVVSETAERRAVGDLPHQRRSDCPPVGPDGPESGV